VSVLGSRWGEIMQHDNDDNCYAWHVPRGNVAVTVVVTVAGTHKQNNITMTCLDPYSWNGANNSRIRR
jgi:hypothetical protein